MKKKLSLSFRLIITMILLVAGTVVLCWFLNTTFLEKYYGYHKQKELLESFAAIDAASENGTLSTSDFDIPFERICSNGNMTILIIGTDHYIVRSSSSNSQTLQYQLNEIMYGLTSDKGEIIQSTERYMLERQMDSRMESEYLMLWGTLTDGSIVYMRTALESIRESAVITNRFFMIIGSISIAVSAIIIIWVSRNISRPIRNLSDLSRKMTNLDFEAKYIPDKSGTQEIDALGMHMNELSMTLQKTIEELKSANNELKQDIEKKNQIDEMRKEFLSNVSHELKTPLALIQGYAEGLQEGVNDDEESRNYYCGVIVDEAGKMNRMVKKLLTLNQLEFGNDIVEMNRFELTELICGVVNASSLLAKQEGITIQFDCKKPIYVWGDEFKVEEVISNYLSNAIHYAKGEKKITLSCQKYDGIVRVKVKNTGDLIPEADLDKIWVKFYKVDKARTREYGGSGIGLSIVKAIMDSFHQKCGVQNMEDGVEFWMELECSSFL